MPAFNRISLRALALATLCLGGLPAMAQESTTTEPAAEAAEPASTPQTQATAVNSASATILDRDSNALGTLALRQTDAGVEITGELTGLPPGEHGFHIHETGACGAAEGFESAGGHYEPEDHQHGFENEAGPHGGDLENLAVADDGSVSVSLANDRVELVALAEDDGSALVIHAEPDDYVTDPSGNSGDRIACGVVETVQ